MQNNAQAYKYYELNYDYCFLLFSTQTHKIREIFIFKVISLYKQNKKNRNKIHGFLFKLAPIKIPIRTVWF